MRLFAKKTHLNNPNSIFLFFFIFCFSAVAQTVTFTSFPRNIQLFVRNKSTNLATVPIAGSVNASTGYTSVVLQLYKNNQLLNSFPYSLSYISGIANFNYSIPINAELSSYTFKLVSNTNILLKEALNVTAGDVYIITGQSNSVNNAGFPQTGNPFRITYLGNSFYNSNQNLGGIGYNFANQVITNNQTPILILNGGQGGQKIDFFQRDDVNSYNSSTNYGLLLKRFTDAGLTPSDVTAIIWYQGESDGLNTKTYYLNLFSQLYTDWKQDYNPSHFYVYQVHSGCVISATSEIPEAHRQLPILFPDVQVISTNGALQGTDQCHYFNTNGYYELAERLYNLINYDVYGSTNTMGIYSPNITNCHYINNQSKLSFELTPPIDTFNFESGVHSDFFFENSSITILGGSVSGNIVTLQLSEPITNNTTLLSYLGRVQANVPYIKNQNGIGLLSFKSVVVSSPHQTMTNEFVTGTYTYDDLNRDPEGNSTYQWYVADDANGTNQTAIVGATAKNFTVTNAQANKYLGFGVTPIALTGITTGAEVVYYRPLPVLGQAAFTIIGASQASNDFYANRVMDETNAISININVTTPGTIAFTTNTVNGYNFSSSGTYTAGLQNIILRATGTQTNYNASGDTFTITGSGTTTQTTNLIIIHSKFGNTFTSHYNGITTGASINNVLTTYDTGETFNNNTSCTSKGISVSPCTGTTITVGVNTYPIANINGQCWMTQNLKEAPNGIAVNASQWLATNVADSGFYGYYNTATPNGTAGWRTSEVATGEGLLYQWSAAMSSSITERAQGICPTGWHIPSDCEWMYLEHGLGMALSEQVLNNAIRSNTSDNQGTPGYKLRSVGIGQTNSSGFAGLLAGYRVTNGVFYGRGSDGLFWTSTAASTTSAFCRILSSGNRGVNRTSYNTAAALQIRCLKD
jgi:uncharacterized protein (TIGR02145 family)